MGRRLSAAKRRRRLVEETIEAEIRAELRLKEEEEFLAVILGVIRYVWSI